MGNVSETGEAGVGNIASTFRKPGKRVSETMGRVAETREARVGNQGSTLRKLQAGKDVPGSREARAR